MNGPCHKTAIVNGVLNLDLQREIEDRELRDRIRRSREAESSRVRAEEHAYRIGVDMVEELLYKRKRR